MGKQQSNPYSDILRVMNSTYDKRRRAGWAIGLVTSTDPLIIKYADNDLTGSDLLVNYHLVPGHREQTTIQNTAGTLNGSVDCTVGSITKMSVSSGAISGRGIFGGVLEAGDHVAMLCAEDQQTFIVLCKVVDAW